MADDGPIQAIKTFLHQNPPEDIDIPDSVGDAEAVHAVVEQYDEAGLECTEEHAEEIVREARSSYPLLACPGGVNVQRQYAIEWARVYVPL
jgi:hypothetical protein